MRLYLSERDRKIAGVCGGIGETYNIDPTLCRLLWVFVTLITGLFPGVLLYVIAVIIIPEDPRSQTDIPRKPKDEGPVEDISKTPIPNWPSQEEKEKGSEGGGDKIAYDFAPPKPEEDFGPSKPEDEGESITPPDYPHSPRS